MCAVVVFFDLFACFFLLEKSFGGGLSIRTSLSPHTAGLLSFLLSLLATTGHTCVLFEWGLSFFSAAAACLLCRFFIFLSGFLHTGLLLLLFDSSHFFFVLLFFFFSLLPPPFCFSLSVARRLPLVPTNSLSAFLLSFFLVVMGLSSFPVPPLPSSLSYLHFLSRGVLFLRSSLTLSLSLSPILFHTVASSFAFVLEEEVVGQPQNGLLLKLHLAAGPCLPLSLCSSLPSLLIDTQRPTTSFLLFSSFARAPIPKISFCFF